MIWHAYGTYKLKCDFRKYMTLRNVALVWSNIAMHWWWFCPLTIRCHTPEKHYATALKPDLKPKLASVVPSYNRRSSGFRRSVVQLYDGSKTQNAYNFGHGHATDLYFTFLEMGKKVFLVKFFWHRWDSNPRPLLVTIFWRILGPWC